MTGCVNGQGKARLKGQGQQESDRDKKSKVAGLDATAASDKGVPEPIAFADALRVGDGFILADCDPRSTRASTVTRQTVRKPLRRAPARSASTRSGCTPSPRAT